MKKNVKIRESVLYFFLFLTKQEKLNFFVW